MLFAAGCGLIVIGTFLRSRLTDVLVQAEEHAKDGLLDEEQARRRIALARYGGPVMIVLGMATIVAVVWM